MSKGRIGICTRYAHGSFSTLTREASLASTFLTEELICGQGLTDITNQSNEVDSIGKLEFTALSNRNTPARASNKPQPSSRAGSTGNRPIP